LDMSDPDNLRYAVYLIPPYPIAQPVAEIHSMLRKQYGLIAADQFQVHATIIGFFKKADGPLEALTERLDQVFAAQHTIQIAINGLREDPVGIGLDISRLDGQFNPDLLALRQRAAEAVRPWVAPDPTRSAEKLDRPFHAHITLAFRDIPPALREDVRECIHRAPVPSEPFVADTFHFLAFSSEDWTGRWEQTLRWRVLKSWQLKSEAT
jgi:2'-5' RNA ligase